MLPKQKLSNNDKSYLTSVTQSEALSLQISSDLNYLRNLRDTLNQKQPPRDVPRKRYSENKQQIYRRTPMPKGDFNFNHSHKK